MLPTITVAWLVMCIIGQWSLFALLVTFAWVKSIPQRNNPFLINLILTTLLATIPPCFLLYTGHQDGVPPHGLCFVQSLLMDGVAPMFGTALLVLVAHTWSELRASLRGKTSVSVTYTAVKFPLLMAPYIVMASWCTASTMAALKPSARFETSQFVYCANNPPGGIPVRRYIGLFMSIVGILELFFIVWIACMVFAPFKFWRLQRSEMPISTSPSYHANVKTYIRISIFSALQMTPIILALLNSERKNSLPVKQATQVLESMNAIATFLVFGTQKNVLEAWYFWRSSTELVANKPTEQEIKCDWDSVEMV